MFILISNVYLAQSGGLMLWLPEITCLETRNFILCVGLSPNEQASRLPFCASENRNENS